MSLKRNVIANFAGSAWTGLMALAFVPLYIQLMGVESYGIVGVFSSLMAVMAVLDLGLSQAMSREMARLSIGGQNTLLIVETASTLELAYWCIAAMVGLLIILLAYPIASFWLNPEQLSRDNLEQAIQIMGVVIGLRWPVSLYMGGLNGMQRQVQVNVLLAAVATLQGIGALAALWFFAPTIQVFFLWQAVMALLQVAAFRAALWRSLPSIKGVIFNKNVFGRTWRFAAGMSGISLLATILTQLDKIVLSKVLSLPDFGYYTFATTVAGVLFRLIGPVFTAYYPRLTELAAKGDYSLQVRTYHEGSQLMVAAIAPATLVMILFSSELLSIWTRNPDLIANTALLVGLLSVGNALNGLMHMPYALQLASGWTKLALYQNIFAVVLLGPAIYIASMRWGALGAAFAWIILNLGYLLIGVHVMHRRLLEGEKKQWYLSDVIKPLIAVIAVSSAVRLIVLDSLNELAILTLLLATFGSSTMVAVLYSSELRNKLAKIVAKK
jgi:O-antigen/teichoic acid export membrane protein